MLKTSALLFFSLIYTPTLWAGPAFHTSPACWNEPRIHTEARTNERDLEILRINGTIPDKSVRSSNRAYAFFVEEEAVPESGTSNIELTIYNERAYLLRILLHQIRGISEVKWINEHLLFLRVWWGRIAGTDYVIDVEREKTVYRQAVRYGQIAFQQFKQCQDPDWSSVEGCRCYPGAPQDWKPRVP